MQSASAKAVAAAAPLLTSIPPHDCTHDINKWRVVEKNNLDKGYELGRTPASFRGITLTGQTDQLGRRLCITDKPLFKWLSSLKRWNLILAE